NIPLRKRFFPPCVPVLGDTGSRRSPNPRSKPMPQKKPDPCSFIIFGVTGDLTHRLVVPALYNLAASDLLPDKFSVVAVPRHRLSSDALHDDLMKGLRKFATRPVDAK